MIVVIGGAAGSGKSTVGSLVAGRLGWVFEDGDALHPAANVAKMRAGQPLGDDDRRPWLAAVGAWADDRDARGESAVVACSALKRSYRDALRRGRPGLRVVLLQVSRASLAARLAARHGHFFPAAMLDSQLADLQPPGPGDPTLVVSGEGTPGEVADEVVRRLGLAAGGPRPAG